MASGSLSEPWWRAVRAALPVWLGAGLAYLTVSVYFRRVFAPEEPDTGALLDLWNRWDTLHYLGIVSDGYARDTSWAFYPLYPGLIKVVSVLTPASPLLAACVISVVSTLAALTVLHRLTESEFGAATARRTIFYLAAFPTAFFLMAPYNESLFAALSFGAVYAARQGRWWSAGVLGALSSADRLFGLLLMIPLALEYLRQCRWQWRRVRLDVLSLALVPLGLAAFSCYCWIRTGDALKFLHAQQLWERTYHVPGLTVWQAAVDAARQDPLEGVGIRNLTELVLTLLVMTLVVLSCVGPWRLRADQSPITVYGVVVVLLLLSTRSGLNTPLSSVPRFVLEMITPWMVLGRIGRTAWVDRLYLLPALSAQSLLLLIHLRGMWVA